MRYQGKCALVTGASSGIGLAFAEELARRGAGLALVARRVDRLTELAARLTDRHGVPVTVIPQDLTAQDATERIAEAVADAGHRVDVLVNNAGFGTAGRFVELTPDRIRREIDLDVGSLVALTRTFLPGMVDGVRGTLINLASIAALQPVPYMAVYGAAKAFVLSFSQALAAEHRRAGVRVVAVCPGPVRTEFFTPHGDLADGERAPSPVGPPVTPEFVARRALRAVDRGRDTVLH